MRIALVGAGSLGTIAGALLSKAGLDIVLVDANGEHVDALNARGAEVVGNMELLTPVKAIKPEGMEGTYDLFIYMVKGFYDETALPQILPHLGEDSALITLQNGVPEEKVASFIGRERTLGGAVGWGATWIRPGVSELTSEPENMVYDIGELDGRITERIQRVKEVLDNAGEARISDNLIGVRWTKLMANVSLSGLSTALGCTYGDILDNDKALTAAAFIFIETINTANAAGIKMEPLYGADPNKLLDIARDDFENAKKVLSAVTEPHRNIVGSMLQDLKKSRPCEVEALNGHLFRTSAEVGIATPVNDQVTEIIRSIQDGNARFEFSNLDEIELPELESYL